MSDLRAAAESPRRHLSLVPALVEEVSEPAPRVVSVDRDEAIAAIRAALRRRSGKVWSVRGGRGTTWGWIKIIAPPRRCGADGAMTEEDRVELAELLGLDPAVGTAHRQGIDVPSSTHYRHEYIARAEGREPEIYGYAYWD